MTTFAQAKAHLAKLWLEQPAITTLISLVWLAGILDVATTHYHFLYAPRGLELNPLITGVASLYVIKAGILALYTWFALYAYKNIRRLTQPLQAVQLNMFYGTLLLIFLAQFFAATSNFAGLVQHDFYSSVKDGTGEFVQEGTTITFVEGGQTTYSVDTKDNTGRFGSFALTYVILPVLILYLASRVTTWHYYRKKTVLEPR